MHQNRKSCVLDSYACFINLEKFAVMKSMSQHSVYFFTILSIQYSHFSTFSGKEMVLLTSTVNSIICKNKIIDDTCRTENPIPVFSIHILVVNEISAK